jgi:hypothetical protein
MFDRELTDLFAVQNEIARAAIHAVRGQADQALEWLERAVAVHARSLNGLQGYPPFRSLRAHPRYAELLRKINLTAE